MNYLKELNNKNTEFITFDKNELISKIGISVSDSTLKTYKVSVQKYIHFCEKNNLIDLASSIINYVEFLMNTKKLKFNTIKLHVAAIKYYLNTQSIKFDSNEIKNLMKSVSLNIPEKQKRIKQAKSFSVEMLIPIFKKLNHRDKLIFSLLLYGAFRVSELINIKIDDIQKTDYGFVIEIQKSKNLKTGEIFIKQFAKQNSILCPIKALENYILKYKINDGFLIQRMNKHNQITGKGLTRQSVSEIVKRRLKNHSTHSFRRSFIAIATKNGSTINEIMEQSGHKTPEMVIHYAKAEKNINNNAMNNITK
jgi:integrase